MTVRAPYVLASSLCCGLAAATVVRAAVVPALLLLALAAVLRAPLVAVACALAVAGWWWGSERLHSLDRSALFPHVGTAARAVVEVQEPPRTGLFETRVRALVTRWGARRLHEPVLLELPEGRAPPQGARLSVLGVLRAPRGPSNGFDERAWLRRHGVHVVLRADAWRRIGRRGGLGGVADRLHAWLARDGAPGLAGERRGVIEGVVLGEDGDLSGTLKQRFRASGLYHLLAVSGSNVVVVASGVLGLAWLLGISRLRAELAVLVAIAAYVLAVGPQPSVIRAGVAGALASLAWLTGRQRDRWYALLVAAVVLLAWNPVQRPRPGLPAVVRGGALDLPARAALPARARGLSAAVAPARAGRDLRGVRPRDGAGFMVPVPRDPAAHRSGERRRRSCGRSDARARARVARSSRRSRTAPAVLLAWLNGWCAAYLAGCARFFGGLPGAQIRSGRAAAAARRGGAPGRRLCLASWPRPS